MKALEGLRVRIAIHKRVLRGMSKERYAQDGEAAYKEAEKTFTSHQMGALHRKMSQWVSDVEGLDYERF